MERDAACRATRKDGRPCASAIVLESGYCPMHDPARQRAVAAGRVRGGQNKATGARLDRLVPSSLRPVIAGLLDALDEVHRGDLDPKRATAMAALAGAIVRAYSVGVLEDRVAALEAEAATSPQEGQGRA